MSAMSAMVITKDNYEKEVLASDKPVLLDFWANWCAPCLAMSPVVEQIAAEQTHVKVGKVDVEVQKELAMRFKVRSIPTLVLIKGGVEVNRAIGMQPKGEILSML